MGNIFYITAQVCYFLILNEKMFDLARALSLCSCNVARKSSTSKTVYENQQNSVAALKIELYEVDTKRSDVSRYPT